MVRIIILAGKTFQGVTHFEETKYDVSPGYAEYLVAQGIARLA